MGEDTTASREGAIPDAGPGPDGAVPGSQIVATERAADFPSREEKLWSTGVHLAALIALLGVPFGNIIGPLVVWLIRRHEMPFFDEHGKEAINFQISLTIWGFVIVGGMAIAAFLLTFLLIGVLLWPVVAVLGFAFYAVGVVCSVVAAIKASDGEYYRYPMAVRFVK